MCFTIRANHPFMCLHVRAVCVFSFFWLVLFIYLFIFLFWLGRRGGVVLLERSKDLLVALSVRMEKDGETPLRDKGACVNACENSREGGQSS